MITTFAYFWIGFILVGLSILAFDSLLWGFLIGELLSFIILVIDSILDALHAKSEGGKR